MVSLGVSAKFLVISLLSASWLQSLQGASSAHNSMAQACPLLPAHWIRARIISRAEPIRSFLHRNLHAQPWSGNSAHLIGYIRFKFKVSLRSTERWSLGEMKADIQRRTQESYIGFGLSESPGSWVQQNTLYPCSSAHCYLCTLVFYCSQGWAPFICSLLELVWYMLSVAEDITL